jgi:hypothetical protein
MLAWSLPQAFCFQPRAERNKLKALYFPGRLREPLGAQLGLDQRVELMGLENNVGDVECCAMYSPGTHWPHSPHAPFLFQTVTQKSWNQHTQASKACKYNINKSALPLKNKQANFDWGWWCLSAIPALGSQRQRLKTSLGYIVRPSKIFKFSNVHLLQKDVLSL